MIEFPRGILPERSAEDIFAGRVRFTLGGVGYVLPTLPIAAEEEWLANIDTRLSSLLGGLETAGNDVGAMVGLLIGSTDLLDALYAYDATNVLPSKEELRKTARSGEVLSAVLGVWRAANPKVDFAMLGMLNLTPKPSPEDTSSPPQPGDGTASGSAAISAPSASSPTSTPHTNGATRSSRRRSKR